MEALPGPVLVFERKSKFQRERFADIEPRGSEWLVKHFLPATGVGILAGPSTVGKSFVTLYFSLRIAMGKNVLGHRTRRAGVLYVASEGQDGMRKRIKALRQKFSLKTDAFQLVAQAPNLVDQDDMEDLAAVANDADVEMQAAAGVSLGLIIIDTTAASMPGGNENASEDMSRALANAQVLAAKTGTLVLLIGHTGKNETLGVRGWSGQIGNSDVIIYLTNDEEDPSLRLGRVYKLKDGEGGEQFAYRLTQISMGYDADGDEITSAYPTFEEAPMAGANGKKSVQLKPGQQLIMRAMHMMLDAGQSETVPPVPGVPPLTRGVRRTTLREKATCMGYAGPDDKPESVKRSMNRDIAAMAAANVVRVEGEIVWPIRR